jgi:Pyruvate/2-oxoacid:ferredoxin oxidoreductase delta subunit
MIRALIQAETCANCQPCPALQVCENKAIFREKESDKPWVDFYLCRGCMDCKVKCLPKAIEFISRPCDGKPSKGW